MLYGVLYGVQLYPSTFSSVSCDRSEMVEPRAFGRVESGTGTGRKWSEGSDLIFRNEDEWTCERKKKRAKCTVASLVSGER